MRHPPNGVIVRRAHVPRLGVRPLLLLAAITAACAAEPPARQATPPAAVERTEPSSSDTRELPQTAAQPTGEPVTLTAQLALASDTLTIAGTTDLPDGVLLTYEVYHETFLPVGGVNLTRADIVAVDGGAYTTRIELLDWPAGTVAVVVVFRPGLENPTQPQAVRARYGPAGERLTGSNVRRRRGANQVEARAEIVR